MRWDKDNAEAILALAGLYSRHLWGRYWNIGPGSKQGNSLEVISRLLKAQTISHIGVFGFTVHGSRLNAMRQFLPSVVNREPGTLNQAGI